MTAFSMIFSEHSIPFLGSRYQRWSNLDEITSFQDHKLYEEIRLAKNVYIEALHSALCSV